MVPISKLSHSTLRANGVSELVITVAQRMTRCILDAADDTANSTDDDRLYDDPTGRGVLLYRRARNRMSDEFEDDAEVEIRTDDNAFHLHVDGCVLSFYSSRDGVDDPHLAGSKTKRRVVTEMQVQMEGPGFDASMPRRLVLLHVDDEDGLVRAAFGVMSSRTEWAWHVVMYDRFEATTAATDHLAAPSYEQQAEAELPAIPRRDEATRRHGVGDNLGS